MFDSDFVKEIHPRGVSKASELDVDAYLFLSACGSAASYLLPLPRCFNSNLFKKLFTKTKNGLGKVRKSLAVKKDKAVEEEVRLLLVWYAKRVTNQFTRQEHKLASCSFSHDGSVGEGMLTCQGHELENVKMHE